MSQAKYVEINLQPSSKQDWFNVARDRGEDAKCLLGNQSSTSALYLSGYIIECSLKAVLRAKRSKVPHSHEIRDLWIKTGLRRGDFHQELHPGLDFFFHDWRVSLRYELEYQPRIPAPDLLVTAQKIGSRIQALVRKGRV